ncbi:hypothetical protein MUP29_12160, partial [bacterium]|nr:hypothetical protein [bacterium]
NTSKPLCYLDKDIRYQAYFKATRAVLNLEDQRKHRCQRTIKNKALPARCGKSLVTCKIKLV